MPLLALIFQDIPVLYRSRGEGEIWPDVFIGFSCLIGINLLE
jgi:hypothetical protein